MKYAKIINDETKKVSVILGNANADFIKDNGYTLQDVEQSDIDNDWYLKGFAPMKTDEDKAREEAERINMLTMTALDFITFLQEAGLTLEQINAYLETNLAVKMQLTYCQNVYCGVAKSFMPVTVGDLTITADMVEETFKIKNKYEGEQ